MARALVHAHVHTRYSRQSHTNPIRILQRGPTNSSRLAYAVSAPIARQSLRIPRESLVGNVRSSASAGTRRNYLFAGMVRCSTGHQPLSMHGKARKGHRYYACGYAMPYGDTAAVEAHAGQKSISVREDWLERLVLRFFEQRIFGPMRLEKLAKQLRAHDRQQRRSGQLAGTRIRQQVSDLDRKIKAQVVGPRRGDRAESWSPSGSESCASRRRPLRTLWPGSAASGRRPRTRS